MRDPFANPFPETDPDRRAIWEMLVERDITAFLAADWAQVENDFLPDEFTAIDGRFSANPDDWRLTFFTLDAYRQSWLDDANDFAKIAFSDDPRTAIFKTTTLETIEIAGDRALAHKKFDGGITRADGTFDRMNWQTVYYCRRDAGRWKLTGFTGYLPNPMG